jgi:hypothetical protein
MEKVLENFILVGWVVDVDERILVCRIFGEDVLVERCSVCVDDDGFH